MPPVTISYSSDNGSVPPPHRRSLSAALDADGALRVERTRGYGDADREIEVSTAAPDVVAALVEDLRRLGLFTTAWSEPDRRVVGGSARRVEVRVGDDHAVIPSAVVAEQREARDAIVACVQKALGLRSRPQPGVPLAEGKSDPGA